MTLTLALTAGNAVNESEREAKISVTVIDLSDEKVSCNERYYYLLTTLTSSVVNCRRILFLGS
jgi:predicted component of type VI protein secretion system